MYYNVFTPGIQDKTSLYYKLFPKFISTGYFINYFAYKNMNYRILYIHGIK